MSGDTHKAAPKPKKPRAKRRKGSKYYELKKRVRRRCPTCKAIFITVRDNQLYCCPACKNKSHYTPVFKIKTCVWCGKKFMTSNKRTHCDDECTRQHKIHRLREARLGKTRS